MMLAEEGEEKWVKHYSSYHRIFLVGEGDFSFSSSLAMELGSASNIVATSLDSYDAVIKKYKNAKSNLGILIKLGAVVIHGLDSTKMRLHHYLRMQKFDRIIFNFPHAGFHGREDNKLLIDMHQKLIDGFFRNAIAMLREEGEVHVSHKTTPPFSNWNIREIAAWNYLELIECCEFNKNDYPGYNQKRGEGSRCDQPFPLGPCSTFKFVFSKHAVKEFIKPIHHRNVLPFVHHHRNVPLLRMNTTATTTNMNLLRFSGGYLQDLPERKVVNHNQTAILPRSGNFSSGCSYDVMETLRIRTCLEVPGCRQIDGFGWQVGNGRTRISDSYGFNELQRIETLRSDAELRRSSEVYGHQLNKDTRYDMGEAVHW